METIDRIEKAFSHTMTWIFIALAVISLLCIIKYGAYHQIVTLVISIVAAIGTAYEKDE